MQIKYWSILPLYNKDLFTEYEKKNIGQKKIRIY